MTVKGLIIDHLSQFAQGKPDNVISDQRAVTAVEYALIIGVMAAALVISVPAIAPGINGIFNHVSSEL